LRLKAKAKDNLERCLDCLKSCAAGRSSNEVLLKCSVFCEAVLKSCAAGCSSSEAAFCATVLKSCAARRSSSAAPFAKRSSSDSGPFVLFFREFFVTKCHPASYFVVFRMLFLYPSSNFSNFISLQLIIIT